MTDHQNCHILECNICLEAAKLPVVSFCGHLFCWPCLYQWFKTKPRRPVCPVCKASINQRCVLPLYARNAKIETVPQDGDQKIPPRPNSGDKIPDDPNFTLPKIACCAAFLIVIWGLYAWRWWWYYELLVNECMYNVWNLKMYLIFNLCGDCILK